MSGIPNPVSHLIMSCGLTPIHPVLQTHLDKLLRGREENQQQDDWSPKADVVEFEDHLEIYVDAPGVDPAGINVEVDQNHLVISGSRENIIGEGVSVVSERAQGRFSRKFRLSDHIDTDAISATGSFGVLVVKLPKKAVPQARKVDVVV